MPGKTTKPIAGVALDMQAPGTGYVQPMGGGGGAGGAGWSAGVLKDED